VYGEFSATREFIDIICMAGWNRILAGLNTGKSGGGDAVNKPLLLLFVLTAAARNRANRFVFPECEASLRDAQMRFGSDPSSSPHMAFWHLQSDGCWLVNEAATIPLGKDLKRPNISTMRKLKVCGEVPDSLWKQLVERPSLRRELATFLLLKYFKEPERLKVIVYFWLS